MLGMTRLISLALAAASAGLLAQPVSAQTYPSQPIRFVVGGAPSTPPDILARVVATELTEAEKWATVVENRPGALQVLAGAEVLKSPADGLTLYSMSLPATAAPTLVSKVGFDIVKDFQPVIQVARSYNVLVLAPTVEAKSLADLVALLKAQPDKLNFSSGGLGTPAHLVGELFKQKAAVRAAHVPYAQFPQSIADLLNSTNHYMFITTLPVIDLINTGKLKAVAVTSPVRLPALKDVPTVGEQGFADLTIGDWSGLLVKSGTPTDIVAKLNAALNAVLKRSKAKEAFARLAAEPVGGTAEAFGKLLGAEIERWGSVIRTAGIKPQ